MRRGCCECVLDLTQFRGRKIPNFEIPHILFATRSKWESYKILTEIVLTNLLKPSTPIVNHEPGSSVLDTAFSSDGTTVFSCGTDKAIRMWSLASGQTNQLSQQIGAHDAPVKGVEFIPSKSLVVSGGWDRQLKFWDCRSPTPAGQIELPERVYSMDVRDQLLVVATANRQIISYDLSGAQPREHSKKDSPLKYQSRCVSAFPDNTGFAVGSIEGRVAIHYLQKVPGKESFAFKCHRQENSVYAVNAIAFHEPFGTFATVGSDGVVNFWDKDNKQRLKGFPPIQRSITCAAFNTHGNLFAYSSSYDWSKGASFHQPQTPDEIWVHCVVEEEIKPKSKSKGLKTR